MLLEMEINSTPSEGHQTAKRKISERNVLIFASLTHIY